MECEAPRRCAPDESVAHRILVIVPGRLVNVETTTRRVRRHGLRHGKVYVVR